MDRVYQYYREPGQLFPYDIRFDVDDIAYCERQTDGTVRFRLLTEPGFTEATLAGLDGTGTPMKPYARTGRFTYWEAVFEPLDTVIRFTFALRFGSDRFVYLVPAGITNAAERLDYWELDVADIRSLAVPEWARGALIYQIFPDRFAIGDPTLTPTDVDPWGTPPRSRRFQGGDLIGVAHKAGYLSELGVDAVYLNPVFTSPSNHGYDAVDYFEVDPRLGGNEALAFLVDELHGRSIRVILDASFNHCHPRFFAFADVAARGEESEFWDWFEIHQYPLNVTIRPEVAKGLYGDRAQPFLEYHTASAEEAGLEIIEQTNEGPAVEPSYAAWYGVPTMPLLQLSNPETRRYFLDVATHWPKEYNTDGWRMDVARYVDADFWVDFRNAVKEAKPDAYLIAEIMGDAMPWLQGDRFDATMNYQFRELAADYFARAVIDSEVFLDGLIRMYARYTPDATAASQNLLGSHDTPRFLTVADGNVERMALAMFAQMTLPGAPGLYYGDEVGMTGGEEPGSRGAFPWHEPASWDQGLLQQTRALTKLRVDHPALKLGEFAVVWMDPHGFAFTRTAGSDRLLVVVNRRDTSVGFVAPIAATQTTIKWGRAEVAIEPQGVRIEEIPPRSGLVVAI